MKEDLERNPLHERQHGFRSDRSTETAISAVEAYVEKHIMNRQHCLAIFLDITSAFDSISAEFVQRSLLDRGTDPDMTAWYVNYIKRRDMQVNLNGCEKNWVTNLGFPQGGVCSALFWNIIFNPAVEIINKYGVVGDAFGTRPKSMHLKLQKVVTELVNWGKSCGLAFNPAKSAAVFFTRRSTTPHACLRIEGKDVEFVDEVKYLGVQMDSGLEWKSHVYSKIAKCKKISLAFQSVTRANFGPNPKIMKWVYTGLLRPAILYAALNWSNELNTMKIENAQYSKVNNVLNSGEGSVHGSSGNFEESNWRNLQLPSYEQVSGESAQMLGMTTLFSMGQGGIIEHITMSKDEPEWSVNFKKAIVVLFQTQNSHGASALETNTVSTSTTYYRRSGE